MLGWNSSKAYAIRDANAENDRLINQFARWNTARSLTEFIDLLSRRSLPVVKPGKSRAAA